MCLRRHVSLVQYCHEGRDNLLNWIIVIDEVWARPYKPEMKWQSAKWCPHHEDTRFDKICHPQSWWSFWHMTSRVSLCVIPLRRVKLWMQYYQSFQQYHLVRGKHPELVYNAIPHANATAHLVDTVKNVFQCWEWEVNSTLFHFPISGHITMIWFPDWSRHCAGKSLLKERTFEQHFSARWHRSACQVRMVVFATFLIVGIKFSDYFEGCYM